jgi:DnaJ-domain-containing protein 1
MSRFYRLLIGAGLGYLLGLRLGRPGLGLLAGAAFAVFAPLIRSLLNPLTATLLTLFFLVVVPHPLFVLLGLILVVPLVLAWGFFSPKGSDERSQKWFDFFGQSDPNRLMVRLMAGLVQSHEGTSEEQTKAVRSFIFRKNPGIRSQFLWKTFQEALDSDVEADSVAEELTDVTGHRQRVFCVRVLASIAACDGSPGDSQRDYIRRVAQKLGLDSSTVQTILNEAESENRHRRSTGRGSRQKRNRRRRRRTRPPRNQSTVREAYETLDLTPSASREEVKEAYQEKVKQHHPDRHQNDGEEAVEEAEEKMAEINQAYQRIKDHWNNAASG